MPTNAAKGGGGGIHRLKMKLSVQDTFKKSDPETGIKYNLAGALLNLTDLDLLSSGHV